MERNEFRKCNFCEENNGEFHACRWSCNNYKNFRPNNERIIKTAREKGMSTFSCDTGFITNINDLCIYKDGEEYRIDLKELLGSRLDKNSYVFNIDNNDIATFEVTVLSNCLTGDMKKYRYKFLIDYKKSTYIVKSKTEIKEK